jgi:hypothetical protein
LGETTRTLTERRAPPFFPFNNLRRRGDDLRLGDLRLGDLRLGDLRLGDFTLRVAERDLDFFNILIRSRIDGERYDLTAIYLYRKNYINN